MTYGLFDVRELGALGDNASDDTAFFQQAIDSAAAITEGGVVLVPPGRYFTTGLKMRSRVTMQGYGPQSILRLVPDVTKPLIELAANDVNQTMLRDIRLRGNKYGGSGGANAHGISYVNSEDANVIKAAELFKWHGDGQHRIFNVTVEAFSGDGMRLWTRATHVDHVHISDIVGNGLRIDGSDNWVSATDINWIGKRGVIIQGGNNQLSQVKVWYIGTDPAYPEGDGFYVFSSRNRISNCEAQDTSRIGLYIHGGDYNRVSGCMFDNIGNLFAAQGIGFNQPQLSGAVVVARYSDPNHARFNRLDFVVAQRSSASNLGAFVSFGTSASDNHVQFTGNLEHILTERPVARSSQTTTFNNVAWFNNQDV